MRDLNTNEMEKVSGGIPLFVALAFYGEIGCFAAMVSSVATYNAIKN